MPLYDRGLLLGSCTGEAFGWPLIVFTTIGSVALVSWLLARRFGLNLRALSWALLAAATLGAGAAASATGFSHLTARLDREGDSLAIDTCFGTNLSHETVPIREVTGRFIVSRPTRSPAKPLLRLLDHDRQLAEVWLEHPGLNLEALAAIVPGAVADYRRWRER